MGESKVIKAVAYCRVSTILGQDPKLQLENIRQFCTNRGFELVKEYVDHGVSGNKDKRPGLDEMIRDARHGQHKVIVCAALDRIGRNTLHILRLISELDHYGVSVISLRENLDFTTPTGRMVLTVLVSIAELERTIISNRIKEALAAKKLIAQRTGSGWRCGRKTVINENIVAEVKGLRAQGVSIRAIGKKVGIAKSSVQRVLGVPINVAKNEVKIKADGDSK